MHHLNGAEPQNLLIVLQGLFRTKPEVQISLDTQNDAIIAVATPEDQKTITNLVQQIEKGLPGETGATVELYAIENVEGPGFVAALTKLLEKQGGKVELSVAPYSGQLVALAKPEQHRLIRKTLDALQGGERTLDILELEMLDPSTAEKAITQLFKGDSLHQPDVEIDPVTDQLFVRGTPEQLKKIRQLLVKMGETGLREPDARPAGSIRSIPVQGDAKGTVAEIERLWPQLSKNPLRVVAPSAVAPLLHDKNKKSPPAPKKSAPGTPTRENKRSSFERGSSELLACGLFTVFFGQVAAEPDPSDAPTKASPAQPIKRKPTPTAAKAATPVLMAVSGNNIIIASEDREALDQMESLLRTMSRQSAGPGRNYHVYVLKHAVAKNVAETLQQLFRNNQQAGVFGRTQNPVVIVPDERMNAILVQAGRVDRVTIENYLKVIDSEETPDALNSWKPVIVRFRNTNASRIEQMLRAVFKSQLGSPNAIPGGGFASSDMTVDQITNSLIITAPPTLAKQIAAFATSLDDSAVEDISRETAIVPLKHINADRAQKILNLIMNDASRGRAR